MSRRYPKSSRVRKSQTGRGGQRRRVRQIKRQAMAQASEVQLPLDVEALLEMTREALSSFAVEMGLKVAQCLLEDEVTQRCGQRHERVPHRTEPRFGHQCKWQPKIRAPGGENWHLKSSAHRCAAGEICEDGGDSRYLPQIRTEAEECTLTWINGPKSVAGC